MEYFNNRTEAISLAKSEKWKEAIIILESLTEQNQNDGDLFYLLGLSYYQTEQYKKAITALKNTLDLGGTNQTVAFLRQTTIYPATNGEISFLQSTYW